LNCLELKANWQYFKAQETERLWDILAELLAITEMTNTMPVELMTAVQDMTLEMNKKGELDEVTFIMLSALKKQFDNPNADFLKIIQKIVDVAQSKPLIKEGMEKISMAINSEKARQEPPAYLNMLAKIAKFEE
jgi:hypothetical protein